MLQIGKQCRPPQAVSFYLCLSGKKCPQVFFNKRVGIFPVNVIAKRILPMRLAEEFDGRFLKLAFIIFPFACHNRCDLRMYNVLKQCRTHFTRKPVGFFGYQFSLIGALIDIDNSLLNFNGRKRYFYVNKSIPIQICPHT